MTDVTPPPAPATTPLWEDFIDIFTSPRAVFERRMADPRFFVAWIVIVILFAVLTFGGWGAVEQAYTADGQRQIEKYIAANPQLPAEAVEQMRSGRGPGSGMAKFIIPIAAGVVMLLVGVTTWLTGKIVGATTAFGQAFLIATYAYIPKLLGSVVAIVLGFTLPEAMLNTAAHLTLGPALALDPVTADPVLMAFAMRLDVFTLWTTALIAIGLRVTGALSTQKAVAAGVIVWILGALIPLGGAMMQR
jgi:hypothetical protein